MFGFHTQLQSGLHVTLYKAYNFGLDCCRLPNVWDELAPRANVLRSVLYTCQLFLKYRREIFILVVLGFLKTTQSFPNIPKEDQTPQRRPKSSKDVRLWRKRKKPSHFTVPVLEAYKHELAPSAFHFKNQRLWGRYCHLFILHMVFVPYMGPS